MAEAIVPFMDRLGGQRRISMVLVAAGALGVIFAFSRWAMAPEFVPITDSIAINDVGSWEQVLADAGVEYRLAGGGSRVEVRDDDYAKARVVVAGAGLVRASSSAAGDWSIFDETGFGGTEFEERVRFRRALEGELSRTISGMRGMDHADVRIALEENSYLRRDNRPTTASVKLRPLTGLGPEPAVVEGIAQLVSNAVPGLTPDNVSIHDDMGRTLNGGDEATGLTAKQLALQLEQEQTLARRAEEILSRMYGAGNALVQVTAEMNFDQIDRASQQYDPDSQVTLREDRAEIIPEQPEQGASSVTSNTVFGTTQTTETLTRSGARLERLSVAVALNETSVDDQGNTTAVTRTPEEIARVEALVASAVGLRPDRGDVITVTSTPWQPIPEAPVVEEGVNIIEILGLVTRPLIALVGVLTALMLAFRLMSNLKEAGEADRQALAAAPRAAPAVDPETGERLLTEGGTETAEPEAEAPRVISAPTPPPVIEIQDPAMTARVLKSWMKEA